MHLSQSLSLGAVCRPGSGAHHLRSHSQIDYCGTHRTCNEVVMATHRVCLYVLAPQGHRSGCPRRNSSRHCLTEWIPSGQVQRIHCSHIGSADYHHRGPTGGNTGGRVWSCPPVLVASVLQAAADRPRGRQQRGMGRQQGSLTRSRYRKWACYKPIDGKQFIVPSQYYILSVH